ncbi:MAG: DUF5666 domain-containing protein [Thiolinea sp.]
MNKLMATIKHLAKLALLSGALLLGGCIEGAGTQLADGIGGTGITMGRLTGFGSVYVNGIHFNTDNAQFIRDGASADSQSDFNIGEIIRVEGTVNADRKTGIASKVIYSDVLEGSVTRVADGHILKIMEQMVITDQLTVFHGFKRLADLKIDNIVEVSGYTDANGNIKATSIKLLSEAYESGAILEIEGTVSQLNVAAQTFKINDLTVHYSQAQLIDLTHAELRNGIYLAVTTNQEINASIMIAAELIKLDDALEKGVIYEIEGLVSYFLATGYFEVDGFPVSTNEDTTFENGTAADIDEDSLLIVTGTANAQGIIVAESVILIDYSTEIYMETTISAVDQASQTIKVLGQTVNVDTHTLLSDDTTDDFVVLNLTQFAVGTPVYIVVYRDQNDDYSASRLSKITPIDSTYLSGQIENLDIAQGQFTLFRQNITSNASTLFLDENFNELSQQEFFNRVDDETQISVNGQQISDDYILADSLIIEVE